MHTRFAFPLLAVALSALSHAAPPVANADLRIIRVSARTTEVPDLLANDTDPDGNPLTIVSVTPATFGDVTLAAGVVSYRPHRDFRGEDSFTYTISDGTATSTATVTVRNPFLVGKGVYSTLFPAAGATNQNAGYCEFNLGVDGVFTGRMLQGGVEARFKGGFDDAGLFTGSIQQHPFTLQFPVDANPNKVITGSFPDFAVTFTANRNPFGRDVPATYLGRFTMLMPMSTSNPTLPGGISAAAIRILPSGRASLTGRLGDGSRWSASTYLQPNGTLPIYSRFGPVLSNIFGTVAFSARDPFTVLSGTFKWFRAANPRLQIYPRGFQVTVNCLGSNFVDPGAVAPILNVPVVSPNVTFRVSGSDITPPKTENATMGLRPVGGLYELQVDDTES
jgi:hypothetical protein